ncbi:MAG: adenylate/guanylate cyclase domain-containing protein [Gammaproteobacteria bacterium]|nr:adenylate/guanylate cyclase domain-containing protein [Gammaproteobacteria bacterium]
MVDQEIQRKLAVLLHADVVDSTNLVRRNETLAHQRIRDVFQRFSETIAAHAGIAHEIRGDALVAEFNKASDAVSASVAFQKSNEDHNNSLNGDICPEIRIGIAMGEVVVADRTVTGEGIVLAQRLEQLAEPGGICLQDAVYQTIPIRLPFVYENLGERKLNGFNDPVRVHAVTQRNLEASPDRGELSETEVGDTKAERPSIAVLPFNNMSSNPEQVYFADGIAEDIITALSRFHDLLVIARNSSFTYRGSSVDVREVGRELNVQYVLEGSVRIVGERVRITAQLVDTSTGNHVWAERFDRPLEDVFEVQDEITALVASMVGQQVRVTEVKSAIKREQQDINARDLIARAQWHMDQMTEADFVKARDYAEMTIRRHPKYIIAFSMLAYVSIMELVYGWGSRSAAELIGDATENALTAIRIDPDDEIARTYLAAVFWMTGKHDDAIKECEAVLRQNSNFAAAMGIIGIVHAHSGTDSYESAVECLEKTIRLSPNDPWLQFYYAHRGTAEFLLGRYDEAIEWYQKSLQRNPDLPNTLRMLISAYALKGDLEKASHIKAMVLKQNPNYSIEDVTRRVKLAYRNTEDFEHTLRGLRLAGVPEI